ncbi:sodium/glucose cotransporter 4-like [Antedon mediterranea]|uniref:sodium/glucose cotransporter 4-like n=1 Tax=Antedon mediterranea TaxID=105859 RepID=UPI003AF6EC80
MGASTSQLEGVDIAVIATYFVVVILVGLGSMLRSNRGSAEGYFLAGGSMLWLPVGASLFASNIGSEHFVGLAGSGAAAGIGVGAFELNALFFCQLLGWVFLPVYMAGGVYTMPDYLQKRFGRQRLRMYIAFLSLLLYIFTKISVDLYSGGIFIQQALQWNLYPSILTLLGITALYTVTGGLAAVIYTDTLQAFVMVIGACILSVLSFSEIGGYKNLELKYMQAYPNETLYYNDSCGLPREDSFHMIRAAKGSDLPWPGFLFGQSAASIWYWATDQVIVQRALASKNLSHGQGGTLLAGFLKILPVFIIVMPGMISRILFPDIVACTSAEVCERECGSTSGCSNLAYPLLVMEVMPKGLRGLMLAVMLSALMSSLTSIFNSGSTIFTMDIWRNLRKFPSDSEMRRLSVKEKKRYELELMIVGRAFMVVLIVISVAWIPVVQNSQGGQLFIYIQEISAYLSPPIAAIFLLAILWHGVNEPGAFWALMAGLFVGLCRMVLDFIFEGTECGEDDPRPVWVQNMLFHYMYFALFLFWLTVVVAVVVSLMTEPMPKERIHRLTFWTRFSTEDRLEEEQVDLHDKKGKDDVMNGVNGSDDVIEETALTKEEIEPAKNMVHENDDVEFKETGNWRKFYDWFCGFSTNDDRHLTDEMEKMHEQLTRQKIYQTKRDKRILNVLLVVILGIGVFLYGWFA